VRAQATRRRSAVRSFLTRRSLGSALAWTALAVGVFLPWCVGAGVKVHLDRHGQPTWEWLYFLHPGRLIVELWATVWFAAPNLILALLAYLMFTGRVPGIDRFNLWEKSLVIVSSLLMGSIASVTTFIEAFADFHPVIFLLPFFLTVVYAGDFALGLLAGVLLALCSYGTRHLIWRSR
jgi:uncharacterized membrane protein